MRNISEAIKRGINWLCYTGLWMPAPLTAGIVNLTSYLDPTYMWSIKRIALLSACSLAAPLYVWSINRIAKLNGKSHFSLIPTNTKTDPYYQETYRFAALRTKPPKEMLFDKPEWIVLGKYAEKYVCVIPGGNITAHIICIGASGSGKTSSVLANTILSNQLNEKKGVKPFTFVMVDIKGELEEKFIDPEDERVAVFNPKMRDKWGFDLFYGLNDKSSEDEVLERIRLVVYNLIPVQQNQTSDRFWSDAPRIMLIGIFLFGWMHKGYRTLPDLVDFVLSNNLKELIDSIIAEVPEHSVIHKLLISFSGDKVAEETLSGIAINIIVSLELLASNEDLRFLLRESEKKIDPTFIEKDISIVLQIDEAYLETYSRIFALLIGSCGTEMTKRMEGRKPVLFILDELTRIAHNGQIFGLQEMLQTGRSRNCYVIALMQSISGLQCAYSQADVQDMLTNFSVRVILQASPEDQQIVDMTQKAFGKYLEKRRSVNAGKNQSYGYSFEWHDAIQPTDLLTLPQKNKVVLLSPSGAFLLDKLQYFKDKRLKKIADEIKTKRAELQQKKEA